MDIKVLAQAVELAAGREPFVLATVVWRRAPSSSHLGSKAIIRPDGSFTGWLGGACAQPTVRREALAAMADGQARLLFLGASGDLERQPDDGIIKVPMACESDGALEIYLEPVFPAPQVVIIGRSPAVFMLTRLATDMDWDVAVIDDGGSAADHPFPEHVRTTLDLSGLGIGRGSAVVVATQGNYDDLALEAALRTGAGYVGLVAAEKRASATLSLLRDRGVPDEQLARVISPAGVDLGPVDNAGIAVSILADLVARRAAGTLTAAASGVDVADGDATAAAGDEPREAADPVCGMTVTIDGARYHARYDGADHWFCGAGCLAAFEKDPASFPAGSVH